MTSYLVFRLYGPLCSWGEIAVGESRHSADHPSRSALLGLFAAALGIERDAEEEHRALSEAWRFGVKLLSPGTLLRDYHTVQAPRRQKNVRHLTRRSELLASDVNTLLSTREYRMDSVSVIAAELNPEARQQTRWTLEAMQAALERPCFPLYLGRKSCPPALPLAPRIVHATSLRAALDAQQFPLAGLRRERPVKNSAQLAYSLSSTLLGDWPAAEDRRAFRTEAVRYFWEQDMHLDGSEADAGNQNLIEFVRHDQPISRRRWQFTPRREWSFKPPSAANPHAAGAEEGSEA